jgi:hypothetical protein
MHSLIRRQYAHIIAYQCRYPGFDATQKIVLYELRMSSGELFAVTYDGWMEESNWQLLACS